MKERLAATEAAVDKAHKLISELSKQQQAHGKRFSACEKTVEKLGQQQGASEKELRSGISRAASDFSGLNQKVDKLGALVHRFADQM